MSSGCLSQAYSHRAYVIVGVRIELSLCGATKAIAGLREGLREDLGARVKDVV